MNKKCKLTTEIYYHLSLYVNKELLRQNIINEIEYHKIKNYIIEALKE